MIFLRLRKVPLINAESNSLLIQHHSKIECEERNLHIRLLFLTLVGIFIAIISNLSNGQATEVDPRNGTGI